MAEATRLGPVMGADGTPGPSPASRVRRRSAVAGPSAAGSARGASGTKTLPSANSALRSEVICSASRVLPTPPGPVRVTRPTSSRRSSGTIATRRGASEAFGHQQRQVVGDEVAQLIRGGKLLVGHGTAALDPIEECLQARLPIWRRDLHIDELGLLAGEVVLVLETGDRHGRRHPA